MTESEKQTHDALVAALQECEETLDRFADVDDGIPNWAMSLFVTVRAALAQVEGGSK